MKKKKIIIPLPGHDFDPTEVAVCWKIVRDAGHQVEFATADGKRGYADPMMISGEGLDPWGWIRVMKKIRIIGLLLRADRYGRAAYRQIERDPDFLNPKPYDQITVDHYDGMILPGGHAPLMRQYLENRTLQNFVADFFDSVDQTGNPKPVGAICHGVVLLARSISRKTGKSVLYGRKTTALTWSFEHSVWCLTRYFARFWDGDYYRTYREFSGESPGYRSVESEVRRGLEKASDFLDVPRGSKNYFLKTNGISRDRPGDPRAAWVVKDGNYISARWPGDVHTFAGEFVNLLNQS